MPTKVTTTHTVHRMVGIADLAEHCHNHMGELVRVEAVNDDGYGVELHARLVAASSDTLALTLKRGEEDTHLKFTQVAKLDFS